MRRLTFCCLLISLFLQYSHTQTTLPFSRGVNLSTWFEKGSPRQIRFRQYTKEDFLDIKSLGADVIRLPINLHSMTDGAPNYNLDPIFLRMLDEVVDLAEQLDIRLILDNHTLGQGVSTDPNLGTILKKVWNQLATRYEPRSERIYYEVFNEPNGISDATWNAIQLDVINEIRTVDTKHTIIVGGADFNSFRNLASIPNYPDNNLIYTFHFYEPFIYTHQGADWPTPSLQNFGGMPFPYNPALPPIDPTFTGTFLETQYNDYASLGTAAMIQSQIDVAYNFQQSRNVPVYCGEFGVYTPNSNPSERAAWYSTVRQHLELRGIGWTIWDYHGGFGLFENGSLDGLFEHDLNIPLLNALGFDIPPQTPFSVPTLDEGPVIYDDYPGAHILEESFGTGTRDFFSESSPAEGHYSLTWSNANRYEAIAFNFAPDVDLSQLVTEGFHLEFSIKGSTANTAFEIRFEDTDAGAADHAWRIAKTIDQNLVTWNGQWQSIRIPLTDFVETGAFEGTYFPPQGDFDWSAVDVFKIVSEQQSLAGIDLHFDNIRIVTNISLAPKVCLQGPYGNSEMSTVLNSSLPSLNPFGPEHPGNEAVNSIPSADITDWLLLELRYPQDCIRASRAVFVKKDGTVVDLDGTSAVRFEGVSRLNYFVAVKHRNHLGAVTSNPVVFTGIP